MKKIMMGLAVAVVVMLGSAMSVLASNAITIDKSRAEDGVITVQCTTPITKTTKVRIEKDKQIYDYFLLNNDVTTYPLQMGAGTYKITVAENVSGTTYRVVKTDTVTVEKFDERRVYVNSIQLINFNGKMVSVTELSRILTNAKTDKERMEIIYKFMITNFKYDFEKADAVASNASYIPVLDQVYLARKGICYDYASLFAAILRANNIPTKLDMGYTSKINAYHAWNQVLIDGEWMIIDTTYDAQAQEHKLTYTMKKDAKDFRIIKQY